MELNARTVSRTPAAFLAGALAGVLAGCVPLENAPAPAAPAYAQKPVRPAALTETAELMAYLLQVRTLSPSALAEEGARTREALARDHGDAVRIKAAVAAQGNGDDADVLSLLEPLVQDSSAAKPELKGVALLLYQGAQERKKARDMASAAAARVRDAQKASETAQAKSEQLRKQVEELEQKLNAVKTIEKSLIQRGEKPH